MSSKWTAEEVRELLLKIAGGPISVTQRVELFDIASAYAERIKADEGAVPVAWQRKRRPDDYPDEWRECSKETFDTIKRTKDSPWIVRELFDVLPNLPAQAAQLWEMKQRACRAHALCNELRLAHPEIPELGDDGVLHDAIHDILRVDTPTAAPAQAAQVETWRPMGSAPRDGTMLRLLVQFEDHATEDTTSPAPTIGAYEEVAECWQFAGWCWTHDHFTEGKGTPVGWLPMLATAEPVAEGVRLIAAERRRQIELEGWSQAHDVAEYEGGELGSAAACYAMPPGYKLRECNPPLAWPWDESWWKPGDRLRELAKAGALIAAEIDRLTAAPSPGESA